MSANAANFLRKFKNLAMPQWSQQQLKPWLECLHNNGVAAAPAEGVYGFVANPFSEQALESLMQIKQRSLHKGLIVLVADASQLTQLCPQPLPPQCQQAIDTYWFAAPPTTLILPALPSLTKLLTGEHATLAVRRPTAPYMLEYLDAFGAPLVSTSLNVAGQPPATQASQLPLAIPALVLKEPLSGAPSRIYNPMENKWLR